MYDYDEFNSHRDRPRPEGSSLRSEPGRSPSWGDGPSVVAGLRFLKAFYDQASHRLRMQDAIGAATATGYPPDELAKFYTQTGAIRTDGDGYVLTPAGQQWYEQEVAWLMSETE